MEKVLVTGAAGFIGSHFLRHISKQHPDWDIYVIDGLNYAASLDRISDLVTQPKFFCHDIKAPLPDHIIEALDHLDYIYHIAAATHVDRSLTNPLPFIESNILGTYHLLEYARLCQPKLRMFIYMSTDEVYGPAFGSTDHSEESPHKPSTVYSATKAAGEDLLFAYEHSMGLPALTVNCMNVIGQWQHREKYLPKIIRSILRQDMITIFGTPDNPGSRHYLYAPDLADALGFVTTHGKRGEKYNIVGKEEVTNLELVRRVERIIGKEAKIRFISFDSVRPGHDIRYSLCGDKMAKLGWTPPTSLDTALEKIIQWYRENPDWL